MSGVIRSRSPMGPFERVFGVGRNSIKSMNHAWACLLFLAAGCGSQDEASVQRSCGYRELSPALDLPGGGEDCVVIASRTQLEQVHSDLTKRCGESKPVAAWRQRIDQSGIDFDEEVLVMMHDYIGT